MQRRRFLATAAAVSIPAATAGCLGGEDGSYEFDADPARIPADARDDAGYEGSEPEEFIIERDVEAAGVSAHVTASTWTATYTNPDRQATLAVASTPNATVAGQSVNPLVQAGDAELIRRLLERASEEGADVEVNDFEEQETETRPILGTETEVTTFRATVSADNGASGGGSDGSSTEDVPVQLHLATVQHEEDVIVLVGVHPVPVDERETVLSLMENTEH